MKGKTLKLGIVALMGLGVATSIAAISINSNDSIVASATAHTANFDDYTYDGSYYDSLDSSLTEGTDGTLRSSLTSLIHPSSVPTYSGGSGGTGYLSGALQYADEDPTNSSNMIYLYTRDSVTKNAASSWNREHVWPQSLSNDCWGTSRAGSDMLHLRPTYSTTNSTRGNLKYGEVSGGTTRTYNSITYGYTSSSYFMPVDSVKGDVARICMYVWVAYYDEYGSSLPALTNVFQSFDVLMQWHIDDAPDVMEGNRNDYAESSMQKNRNPFVDHPEYAWKIFGSKCSSSVEAAAEEAYPENASSSALKLSSSTIKLDVNSSSTLTATATGTSVGTISWTTSNSSIASLNATTGSSVTITSGSTSGTATITASCTIDGTAYTKTCTVTVQSTTDYTYNLVTSSASIADGDEVLIVFKSGTSYYAVNDTTISSYYLSCDNVTVSDGQIVDDSATAFTVGLSGSTYTFTSPNSKSLVNYINGTHYNVNTNSSASGASANWSWTINDSSTGAGYLVGVDNAVYMTYTYYNNTTHEITGSSSNPSSSYPVFLFKKGDISTDPVAVTGVSLNASTLSIAEGNTGSLTATVSPSNATDKTVSWSTSDSSVATVSDGTVTAVAAGTAIITVTTTDGNYTASCTVTVIEAAAVISVTSVELNKSSLTLSVGSTGALTAVVSPTDATNQEVTWSTSNSSVATVSNGTVTAVGAGSAVITVTTMDGGYTATCTITVVNSSSTDTYSLVTSASNLSSGDTVILVGVYNNAYVAMTNTASVSNRPWYLTGTSVSPSNNQISQSSLIEWTVGTSGSYFTFTDPNNDDLYAYIESTHYSINVGSTRSSDSSTMSSLGGANTWTYTVNDSSTGAAKLACSVGVSVHYTSYGTFSGIDSTSSSINSMYIYKKVTSTPAVELQNWIDTYLYMDSYTSNLGYCADTTHAYYDKAKAALLELSSEAISLLQDDSTYSAALARYQAWATANGDNSPFAASGATNGMLIESKSSYTALIILLVVGVMAGAITVSLIVIRKRKIHN